MCYAIESPVDLVLVIEKEAVFNHLRVRFGALSAALGRDLRILLLTGRGNPCMATRSFVSWLAAKLPQSVPFLALVDYNPYGYNIALQYRIGSRLPMDREGTRCERLELLGVLRSHLDASQRQGRPDNGRSELSKKGQRMLCRLRERACALGWARMAEAAGEMLAGSFCGEIESIYQHDDALLVPFVASQVQSHLGAALDRPSTVDSLSPPHGDGLFLEGGADCTREDPGQGTEHRMWPLHGDGRGGGGSTAEEKSIIVIGRGAAPPL